LMEPRNAQVKLNVSIAAYGSIDSFARLSLIQSRLFMISIFLDPSFPTLESLWSLIPDPLTSHLHPTKLTRHGIARLQSRERPSQALWADPHGSRGFRRVADSFGTENCTRYLACESTPLHPRRVGTDHHSALLHRPCNRHPPISSSILHLNVPPAGPPIFLQCLPRLLNAIRDSRLDRWSAIPTGMPREREESMRMDCQRPGGHERGCKMGRQGCHH